jgi:hypothetical protein
VKEDPIQFGSVERRARSVSASPDPPALAAELQSVRETWPARSRFQAMARFVLAPFIDDAWRSQSEHTVFRHEVLK